MNGRRLVSLIICAIMVLGIAGCGESIASDKNLDPSGSNGNVLPVENKLGLQEENSLSDALFNYGLVCVKVGDKWGFINMQGQMVIEPQFDEPGKFYQGVYAVNTDGKYSFINTKGEVVLAPTPGAASFFTEDYCVVRIWDTDGDGNPVNMRSALIDASGKICFESENGTIFWPVRDGMLPARNEKGIAVYNMQGNKLFEIENAQVFSGDESTYRVFYEDLLCVKQGEKWGAVNKQGQWVIQPQFDRLNYFENGIARAEVNDRDGYINKNGEWVIQPQFIVDFVEFSEGLVAVQTDDKAGYIDAEGNWKIVIEESEWYILGEFHQGAAYVYTDHGVGIIGVDGQWICEPQFESIRRFNCGVAPVEVEWNSYGVINTSGQIIVEPQYRSVEMYYDDGYTVAQKQDGKWVILDTQGNVVLDGGYDGIGNYYTSYGEDGSVRGTGAISR